jgi:hypothetical protein
MSRHVDLDARRKAVAAEAKGEPVTVVLDGETFTLPSELPLSFAYYITTMDLMKACAVLVGKDNAERFLDAGPTNEDFEAIVEAYGLDLGEASGSPKSSASTTKRSKRTSTATTASTSA